MVAHGQEDGTGRAILFSLRAGGEPNPAVGVPTRISGGLVDRDTCYLGWVAAFFLP